MKDLLLIPFRALAALPRFLADDLHNWWIYSFVVPWRMMQVRRGKANTVALERLLWELDQEELDIPELWDIVTFWDEYEGVVEGREVGDDGVLRFDVRVCTSVGQKHLRPHEIDRIAMRRGGSPGPVVKGEE